jgi:RNA polymerase sigma-70 factor (ECF subfamily)
MDYYRDAYKKPLSDLENHTGMKEKGSTQEHVEHSIRLEELKSQLRNLTPEQQHVLSLRFSQEFSLEETARVMQKSVGSIKLLQHRAVESLRKQFEKKGWV